jgi:NAD(P)-dependent dehydrogenase (short-subunit alcohol dehydrogenase family)
MDGPAVDEPRNAPAVNASAAALLAGHHVVVTGAAGGIGRAIARLAARRGARVTCADVNLPGTEDLAEGIVAAGGAAAAVGCDVTEMAQVAGLLDAARSRFGGVTGLVANAGGAQGPGCAFLDMTAEMWQAMIGRNLTGAFNTGLIFARHMAASGRGSIVFTTSNTSEIAIPGLAHYAAAKGGVRQLMRTMAVELAAVGVRVNAVAPGATRTPGNRDRMDDPAVISGLAARIPMGRIAQAEEIAGAVAYLLSDDASYTTGASIAVDGGYTCL